MATMSWLPSLEPGERPRYRQIADALKADILTGRLGIGDRLPPLRELAFSLGVTVGTVKRAFDLVNREGFLLRQVGRGTFVGSPGNHLRSIDADRNLAALDFAINRPPFVEVAPDIEQTIGKIFSDGNLWDLFDYRGQDGFSRQRDRVVDWIARSHIRAARENITLTVGGSDALAICLAHLTRPGDSILLEEYTYSGVKNLCRILGLNTIAVPMDRSGLIVEALEEELTRGRANVLLCIPRTHNPTTRCLSEGRRDRIAELCERYGTNVIEDDAYGPNPDRNGPTLWSRLSSQCFHVGSFSKALAPGLRIGFIVAPAESRGALATIAQSFAWMPPPLMAELVARWIEDGTAEAILGRHWVEISARQDIAANVFRGFEFEADRYSPHLWLTLPGGFSLGDFMAETFSRGILVAPGSNFSVAGSSMCNAVRLSIGGSRSRDEMSRGLKEIRDICLKTGKWAAVY